MNNLKKIRESKGITLRELEELSGIPFSSINQIEMGKYKLTKENSLKLSTALGVSPEELTKTKESKDTDILEIRLYNHKLSAGRGINPFEEENYDILPVPRWLLNRVTRLDPKILVAFEITGDSMYPVIRDGDILLLDKSVDRVLSEDIYAVIYGDNLYVKTVQATPTKLSLYSINPKYQPIEIDLPTEQPLRIIGKVLGKVFEKF